MPRKPIISSALIFSLALLSSCGTGESDDQSNAAEAAQGSDSGQGWEEQLVEAPSNPEDLIAIPGSNAILVSSMSDDPGADEGMGHLHLLDPETEEFTEIWPQRDHEVSHDEEVFADCPAPPDLSVASPHGISLEERDDGSAYLYVVNHGGRESVEVFSLEPEGDVDVNLSWIGCAVLPDGTMGNGVVADPESDGFYVSHFFDPSDMQAGFEAAFGDEDTGHVLHWVPGSGWEVLPGSEMSTPNGVEVSEDGQYLFVASWGDEDIRRFTLGEDTEPEIVSLSFMPDNLRWNDQGSLLLTGQDIDGLESFMAAQTGEADPKPGYSVVEIDPVDFTVTEVAAGEPEGFVNPSTALGVNQEIWIGSVNGDNVVRLSQP